MSVRAMPEWLTRRDDSPSPWNVTVGAPTRGEAWTNRMERMMRVPDGSDELARVIRAHEMMHAKVSPLLMDPTPFGVSETTIRCAEEFRVNTLIGVAGFDLEQLTDGSEKTSGKRLAEIGDWNNLVTFMAATAGTKSATELIAGVRSVNPDMAAALKEVEKSIIGKWHEVMGRKRGISDYDRKRGASIIGSTAPSDEFNGYPKGFVDFTVPLAQMLEKFLRDEDGESSDSEDGEGSSEGGAGNTGNETFPDAKKIKDDRNGKEKLLKFRPIVIGDMPLTRRLSGSYGRKRSAAPYGRNPRRMHRMLVDPQRRVFDKTTRGNGGTVLIDLSGSMKLTQEDVMRLLEAAPGCTIIGYGLSKKTDENLWILAEDGKVSESVPALNLTNGNDGPALRFAAQKRRKRSPFIWITDGSIHNGGHLTGAADFSRNLYEECISAIVKHGIHQVLGISEAVDALKNPSEGNKMLISSRILKAYAPRG